MFEDSEIQIWIRFWIFIMERFVQCDLQIETGIRKHAHLSSIECALDGLSSKSKESKGYICINTYIYYIYTIYIYYVLLYVSNGTYFGKMHWVNSIWASPYGILAWFRTFLKHLWHSNALNTTPSARITMLHLPPRCLKGWESSHGFYLLLFVTV